MKKILFFSAMALFSTIISAQDYQISFAILGDNETQVDSVVVHNIAQGNMITVRGNDILNLLASTTGLTLLNTSKGRIKVYPNPFSDRATIEFQNDKQGVVQISLYDMAGKLIAKNRIFHSAGKTIADLRGVPVGAYVIQIDTETSIFSEVILSNVVSGKNPEIIFKGSGKNAAASSPILKSSSPILKSSDTSGELIEMQYNAGDTLSLAAYLGNQISEVKIVPDASSTIRFDFPPNVEDISLTADITVKGGVLQVTDESGNLVTLTFPPGAVMDTTTVSLTLLGEQSNLPIEKRQLRTFEIRPLEINLYEPVVITIEYISPISEIEKSVLVRVRSEEWLTPLSDHSYSDDNRSMSASTLFFGDFAEGSMTLAQLNTQFDLLVSSLGISWESVLKSVGTGSQILCNTRIHKAIWDDYKDITGSFLTFFAQWILQGHYDDLEEGQHSFEEEMELLCTNVVSEGIQTVLDLCTPDDLCDRDYTHTIADMLEGMWMLGCEGPTLDLLEERFDQVLMDCGTTLTIISQLSIEDGGIEIFTTGAVPITLTSSGNHTATIDGNGTLEVSGYGDNSGQCTAVVSGETSANVTGTRDAAYTFDLQVVLAQNAVITTTCPDGSSYSSPLTGASTKVVSLSSSNGYSVTIEESGDGYSYTIDLELINLYTDLPDSK
jgi:hypothetical protein